MYVVEQDKYKVACHVNRSDLHHHGISLDDLVERTPLARIFIKKASEFSKNSTDYAWPGCAFSMQMDFYRDEIVLIFSERIDDFLYNLKQSVAVLPAEQGINLEKMIQTIADSEENVARRMIREFEQSVRDI